MKQVLHPFYRWGTQGSEKISDLSTAATEGFGLAIWKSTFGGRKKKVKVYFWLCILLEVGASTPCRIGPALGSWFWNVLPWAFPTPHLDQGPRPYHFKTGESGSRTYWECFYLRSSKRSHENDRIKLLAYPGDQASFLHIFFPLCSVISCRDGFRCFCFCLFFLALRTPGVCLWSAHMAGDALGRMQSWMGSPDLKVIDRGGGNTPLSKNRP